MGSAVPAHAQLIAADTARARYRPILTSLPLLGSEIEDRARIRQITGQDSTKLSLMRSVSSLTRPFDGTARWPWIALVSPEWQITSNTGLPFSLNDGALWAGVGRNDRWIGGVRAEWGPVRLIVAPELVRSTNRFFRPNDTLTFFAPRFPPDRSEFSSPWNIWPYSIDAPLRFGNRPIERLDAGQSSLVVGARGVEIGVANENEWWGPGIRNALLLTNNAAGFPHLFVRTARPLHTPIGEFEARWLVGGLTTSAYFDTMPARLDRALSAAALSWSPSETAGLTVGLGRVVYGSARNLGDAAGRWFDVFADVGQPDAVPVTDTIRRAGREQLISLFGRWVFPADGLEIYTELGRSEFPVSLRDFLVSPNHTLATTAGLQWARPIARGAPWLRGVARVQAEATFAEQGPTWRQRPLGSWYTSRVVPQGYTQRGEVIGAGIGQGSSEQWLATDYEASSWRAGAFVERIRWNNDAFQLLPQPIGSGWCEHDVTLSPGLRGGYSGRFGLLSTEVRFSNRMNAYFQNKSGCPNGNAMRDVRNRTFSIVFSPFHAPAGRR